MTCLACQREIGTRPEPRRGRAAFLRSSAMSRPKEEVCFNCGVPIPDCDCGDTETRDDSQGPICPYCGHLNRASDSGGHLYNSDIEEYDCEECQRVFDLNVRITYTWETSRREESET